MTSSDDRDRDGRHDFDFLYGRWSVTNRKLRAPLEPDSSQEWLEFESDVRTEPALAGLGNVERYVAPHFPDRPGFEAMSLRLFDVDARCWRIWWISTAAPGQLDTPVEGRFTDDRGVFECDDVLGGRAVKVRYEWLAVTSPTPEWRQSFSFDEGSSWAPNWTMAWRRN